MGSPTGGTLWVGRGWGDPKTGCVPEIVLKLPGLFGTRHFSAANNFLRWVFFGSQISKPLPHSRCGLWGSGQHRHTRSPSLPRVVEQQRGLGGGGDASHPLDMHDEVWGGGGWGVRVAYVTR